jgi:hypothetical protein
MLHWLGLDRTTVLREVVASYEQEIELEKERVDTLQRKLAEARFAGAEMRRQSLDGHVQAAGIVTQELQARIESTEKQIEEMDRLLGHFRGELSSQRNG